jgi:hypothetical protein
MAQGVQVTSASEAAYIVLKGPTGGLHNSNNVTVPTSKHLLCQGSRLHQMKLGHMGLISLEQGHRWSECGGAGAVL